MAFIQDLPEEILLIIFDKVSGFDHPKFQRVCRSWVRPAHTLILKQIWLSSTSAMQKFIKSIDSNPHPAYLQAVKKISISRLFDIPGPIHFDLDSVKKLLFRFPNITEVDVLNYSILFEDFNDEICKTVIKSCPKLDTLMVVLGYSDYDQYYERMHKIRLLATRIYLLEDAIINGAITQYGSITELVCNFPRLKELFGFSDQLGTFQNYLPIFEQLPNLTHITLGEGWDDNNLAEKCLTTKPKEVQELLLTRLSKVTELCCFRETSFCVNTVKFIAKYLTGLKTFTLKSEHNEDWTELQEQVFCNDMLNLVCAAEKHSSLTLKEMELPILSRCFPIVLDKVFFQLPQTKIRTLKLVIRQKFQDMDFIKLHIEPNKFNESREILLFANEFLSLDEINENFFEDVPELRYVDTFIMEINERYDNHETGAEVETFALLLKDMISVKEVTVDLPWSYADNDLDYELYPATQHPCVKDLTIYGFSHLEIRNLLTRFQVMFLNLQNLKLYYNCGKWDKCIGEFRLVLAKYKLKMLEVDLTPLFLRTKAVFGRNLSEKDDFFVLEVEFLDVTERLLYRISFDLKSISKITDDNLVGYRQGQDFLRANIIVESIQCLKIYICNDFHEEEDYLHEYSKRYVLKATIFDDTPK